MKIFQSIIEQHFDEETGRYRLFVELPVGLEDTYKVGQGVTVTIHEETQ